MAYGKYAIPKGEPKPPAKYIKYGEHHWLQHIDGDGRTGDTVVRQWAPSAQRWVHSGNLGTGSETFLIMESWRYVAHCPMPTIEEMYPPGDADA